MQKGKMTERMLAVGLLAAFFSIGSAYAQTGSATDSASEKPSAATQSSPSQSPPSTESATPAQPSSGASSSGATATGTAMRKADQKMMNDLAQANLAEIKAGEMALQKSQNPEVKAFAQKMVDDHSAAMKELASLAQSKGVTLPTEMDKKHKALTTAMEKFSPERFDKTYLSQGGVSDHKKTSQLVRDIQAKAKDSDLKAMAAKLQPVIDDHLEMAQEAKAKTDTKSGSSGSAGSGSAGSGGASGSGSGAASGSSGSSSSK